MNTIQVSIEAAEHEQEILISELADHHANGFEQTKTHLLAYFPENNFDSYEISRVLQGYKWNTLIVEEQNWNESWEKSFEPVWVDRFCVVRAAFHEPVNDVEHEIVITPKMSFGTGHHATTFLMMKQMKDLDFSGKKVFDFGTGTGILSILAEKMGSKNISAIDVDEWSIANAGENFLRNHCSAITFELSSVIPDDVFDIILANINRNVILQYLQDLKQHLAPGGSLLVSGIMRQDEEQIVEVCNGLPLELVHQQEKDNWICLLFHNRKGD